MIAGIGAIDLGLLAVPLVSLVVGAARGLTFEVMALLGWLVAYFAAHWLAADLAPHLPVGLPGSSANRIAALVLTFVAVLVAWSLLARLLRRLVHATPLSLADRVGGAAFGLVRGLAVLVVLFTVVSWTPAAQSGLWRASLGATWLAQALRAIQPVLPGDVRQWLPAATRI